MKHLKRWLALMVAAALALSLLTGCCTGGISSNLLLEVLMGQVENVSVETDPAFDRALKAAVQRGGSDPDAVLNALVEELEITAPLRFSISGLGSGSAGQQGLDVVFQSGTNPNAAANNAATAWLPILRGLEGNGGAYSARASLVEVNGGYILAIGVKVEQPGDGGDEPEPVTLKSIAVSTNPTKTVYWVNETFDPAGMEITATYSNNTTTTINGITETDKKDVSWTPETLDTAGKQTVTISYGGKSTTVSVTVKEPAVKELKVEHTSLTYTAGAYFSPNQIGTVTASYTYGNDKEINISECDLILTLPNNTTAPVDSFYQFKTAGTYTITVSYKGGKATVEITVNKAALTSIQATGLSKTEYKVGETFSSDGLRVTASDNYNNVQTISASEYTLTITAPDGTSGNAADYKFAAEGKHTLKVSYNNMEATVEITVNPATVTGIEVTQNPTKMTYISGESFNPAGMTVSEVYSDGTKTAVTDYTYSAAPLTKDTTEVTISYGGRSTTVKVEVLDTEDSYQNGTYSIATADGLEFVADLVNGGKTDIDITLDKDITLTGEWTPIGNFENRYTGTFDGGGHTITGLIVNQKERGNVGLIGYLGSGGKVQNLTLENVNLNGNLYVGGVVGYSNNGTVTACTVSGSINGKEYVGGIVGSNYLGTVTACYNTSSTVNGSYLVGGVVGQNNKGIVTACYNASGSIYGEGTVGGVVGDNYTSTVTACYWSNYAGYGIGNDTGDATKVDGTTVTWQTAVDAMNAALQNAGSEWRYELTGELPTLKK